MKPIPNSQPDHAPILAFGAHPDDIEFGCGGVIAAEKQRGRTARFVVCSGGESGSNGKPHQRLTEAANSAAILGANIEFATLGGDARFKHTVEGTFLLAQIIRRVRPSVVLAPSPVEHQHPDHAVLAKLARDAARIARYAGVKELRDQPAHAIDQLLYYAVTVEGEPEEIPPVFVDVSADATMTTWKASMEAHASQMKTRNYLDLQLTRARLNGFRAGVEYAIALFPADPVVIDSLTQLGRGARRF